MNEDSTSETAGSGTPQTSGDELAADALIEEVSIDGMCGVY
ncbi:mycofactocin precursor MftA [Actinoallomurus iriomotensis]|jgi:mycofactocin precursor|uniref:Mycofactocin n=1 Tax=Actinoallomurus iriomotensis TaxID=478107 RepID=A0A9W6VTB5_9ACTN|nr:mycofactocin precursor MftA [Actinoallomurus iriomotensis]GLY79565.1 hypothetical protein Airi01_078320 [Actinoallomurus iriomotensis]GLY88250.1 hypothetical protein Airi02_061790 [Actinoallomurus iriomotensis]